MYASLYIRSTYYVYLVITLLSMLKESTINTGVRGQDFDRRMADVESTIDWVEWELDEWLVVDFSDFCLVLGLLCRLFADSLKVLVLELDLSKILLGRGARSGISSIPRYLQMINVDLTITAREIEC